MEQDAWGAASVLAVIHQSLYKSTKGTKINHQCCSSAALENRKRNEETETIENFLNLPT